MASAAVNRPHPGPNPGNFHPAGSGPPHQDPGPPPQHQIPPRPPVFYVQAPPPTPYLHYQWPMPFPYNPFTGFPGMGYGMVMPPFPPPPYMETPAYIMPPPPIQPMDYRRMLHPHMNPPAGPFQTQTRRVRGPQPFRETVNSEVQTDPPQRGRYSEGNSDSGRGTSSNSPSPSGSHRAQDYALPNGTVAAKSCCSTRRPAGTKLREGGAQGNVGRTCNVWSVGSAGSTDSMVPVCSSSQREDEVLRERRISVHDILMTWGGGTPPDGVRMETRPEDNDDHGAEECESDSQSPAGTRTSLAVADGAEADDAGDVHDEDIETLFKIIKLSEGQWLESRRDQDPAGSRKNQDSGGPAGSSKDEVFGGSAGSTRNEDSEGSAESTRNQDSEGPAGSTRNQDSEGPAGSMRNQDSEGPAGSRRDEDSEGSAGSRKDEVFGGSAGSKRNQDSEGPAGSRRAKDTAGSRKDEDSEGPAVSRSDEDSAGSRRDEDFRGPAGSRKDEDSAGSAGHQDDVLPSFNLSSHKLVEYEETSSHEDTVDVFPHQAPFGVFQVGRKLDESVWSVESLAPFFPPKDWMLQSGVFESRVLAENPEDRRTLGCSSPGSVLSSDSWLVFSTPARKQEVEAKEPRTVTPNRSAASSTRPPHGDTVLSTLSEEDGDTNRSSEPGAHQSPNQETLIVKEQQQEEEETFLLNAAAAERISPAGQVGVQSKGVEPEEQRAEPQKQRLESKQGEEPKKQGAEPQRDKDAGQPSVVSKPLCVVSAEQTGVTRVSGVTEVIVSPPRSRLVNSGVQCSEWRCHCERNDWSHNKPSDTRKTNNVQDEGFSTRGPRKNFRNKNQEKQSGQQETYGYHGRPGKPRGGRGRNSRC